MTKPSFFGQLSLFFDAPSVASEFSEGQSEPLCTTQTTRALYELLGPFGHRLQGIFHRMQLAEGVIEDMKRLNPRHADRIHNAFSILYGTPVLEEAPERLYIAHCQELIHRIVEEEDTRTATMAELIAAIRGVSLITPLKRHVIYLYWELFQLLFPGEASSLFGNDDPILADEWDRRQAEELRAGLSVQLSDPQRVVKHD